LLNTLCYAWTGNTNTRCIFEISNISSSNWGYTPQRYARELCYRNHMYMHSISSFKLYFCGYFIVTLCNDAVVHKIMCKYYIYMYWCRVHMCVYVDTHMCAPLDIFSWDGLKVWQGSHTIVSAMLILTSKYVGMKNVLSLFKENSQVSLANNVTIP
jgi:hypothetical protein